MLTSSCKFQHFTRCPSEKQKHNEHKHTVSQKLQGQNQEVPRTDDATMVTRIKFSRLQNHWTSRVSRPARHPTPNPTAEIFHTGSPKGTPPFSDCRPELEAQAGPSPCHGAQIFSHLHPTKVQSQVGPGSNGTKLTLLPSRTRYHNAENPKI